MKRLAFLLCVSLGLASCRDIPAPVAPSAGGSGPQFHNGGCVGDFHFGDNCIGANGDEGSHYRIAHVSWRQTGPRTAEFTYVVGLRRSFYAAVTVGQVRTLAILNFGDGAFATPPFTVTFVDPASDWFEARATFSHTYAGAGPYTAFSDDCCRLGLSSPWRHHNNPDGWVRIETQVNFLAMGSPQTNLPAVVACPRNGVCQFNVAATAPGATPVTWRLATAVEMGAGTVQPPGASIDPSTGAYTVSTSGLPYVSSWRNVYSTQVVMETGVGTAGGTKSAVDFLIELTDAAVNASPTFDAPTPADGAVFEVPVGGTVTFDVRASDPDAIDAVTLGALNLPPGASFTIPPAGNPVGTTVTWTAPPGSAGSSYVVNLLAQDGRGASASARSIIIRVASNRPPIVSAGGPYSGSEGSAVTLALSGSDEDGDALTYTWDLGDGTTGSGATPPGQHSYADNGTYTIALSVSDGTADPVSATTMVTVTNVAPSLAGVSAPATVTLQAGQASAAVTLGAVTDPGANDGPFVPTISCGGTGTYANDSCTWTHPGTYTITATVTDKDGGTSAARTTNVQVIYPWTGFFQPVENPTIINVVKAGSGVPLKFRIGGNYGLGIMAAGYPSSRTISCAAGSGDDPLTETATAGGSSLTYDASVDQYVYVWKTDRSWTGCRQLTVRLIDGTEHVALFRFSK